MKLPSMISQSKRQSLVIRVAIILCAATITTLQTANAAKPVSAAKPKTAMTDDDVQRLLYLAKDRVVMFRLHVRVNGKSYVAASREMLDKYFGELDANKDGVLTGKELKALPTASSLRKGGLANFARSFRLPTFSQNAADTKPRDGKVTKQELFAYLNRIGIRPFTVRVSNTGVNPNQRIIGYSSATKPDAAGQKLFALLDRNNDKKLSRAELGAAINTLRKSDLDEDETISSAELLPPRSPFLATPLMYSRPGSSSDSRLFLSLDSGQKLRQLAGRLLTRYDQAPRIKGKQYTQKDGTLDRKEIPIEPAVFSRFDRNGDDKLDFDELLAWLRDPPPNVELVLRLGSRRRGEPTVQLIRTSGQLKPSMRSVTGQLANLRLKHSQIDIGGRGASARVAFSNAANLKQQFQRADADNNGYVDKKESRRYGVFVNTFDEMDADKDGKVFLKEMQAYFRRQESLTKSQTILNIADQGRDLFQILDADRDGRLSVTELESLAGRIESWDYDSDGTITISEVPQQFRMSLSQAQPVSGINQFVAFAPGASSARLRTRKNGPKWFLRMDINSDGEVSQREFLGNRAIFKTLDANGNGRIDVREAAAAKK